MSTRRNQLIAFHRAGKIPILDKPQVPPEDRMRLRLSLIAEEFGELLEAAVGAEAVESIRIRLRDIVGNSPLNVDLVELADAMADLDYVVEGTRLECGIDGRPLADEVHQTNMAKFGPGSWIRSDGKIMKPPNWKPPEIRKLLKKQGWKP